MQLRRIFMAAVLLVMVAGMTLLIVGLVGGLARELQSSIERFV